MLQSNDIHQRDMQTFDPFLLKDRSPSCSYLCKVEVIAGADLRDSQSAMLKLASGLECDSVTAWRYGLPPSCNVGSCIQRQQYYLNTLRSCCRSGESRLLLLAFISGTRTCILIQFSSSSRLNFTRRPHILILRQFLPFNQSSIVRVFHYAIHAQYLGKLVYQT
jgi:hypothetical protein